MKQYARNACGTIALFHIILNAKETYPEIITADSYLDKFYATTSNADSKVRG